MGGARHPQVAGLPRGTIGVGSDPRTMPTHRRTQLPGCPTAPRAYDDTSDFGTFVGRLLAEHGGTARRKDLLGTLSRADLVRAVAEGLVLHLARDRYASPQVAHARAIAHQVSGVLCLTSAAQQHGWGILREPDKPHVSFARNRRLTTEQRAVVEVHRFTLGPDDVVDGVTSKEATLLACLRTLPDDEALAVADSAARAGDVDVLRRVGKLAQGWGASRVRNLVARARGEAANPFESALRSIAETVPVLALEPQVLITSVAPWARPDLVDVDLGVVVEADSFEWHGSRAALCRDARRYNRLVADGWTVLRFSWEDVMFDPDYVRAVLLAVAMRACERTQVC